MSEPTAFFYRYKNLDDPVRPCYVEASINDKFRGTAEKEGNLKYYEFDPIDKIYIDAGGMWMKGEPIASFDVNGIAFEIPLRHIEGVLGAIRGQVRDNFNGREYAFFVGGFDKGYAYSKETAIALRDHLEKLLDTETAIDEANKRFDKGIENAGGVRVGKTTLLGLKNNDT